MAISLLSIPNMPLLSHYVHQTGRERATTFWAACGAVRRETFHALNGFDECYWEPSIEDRELGYRLSRSGAHIRLLKTLQAKHLKAWTASSLLLADISGQALPWTDLVLEQRRFPDRMQSQVSGRLGLFVSWCLLSAIASVWIWPHLTLAFVVGLFSFSCWPQVAPMHSSGKNGGRALPCEPYSGTG